MQKHKYLLWREHIYDQINVQQIMPLWPATLVMKHVSSVKHLFEILHKASMPYGKLALKTSVNWQIEDHEL